MMGTLNLNEGNGTRNKEGGELIGQGTYGCVYYPGIKCPGKKGDYKKYVTKLEVVDHSLKNELEISKLIREIKNYKKFFVPIIKKCPINISSLSKDDIQPDKCELFNKNSEKKFILVYMHYIKGKDLFYFINDIKYNSNIILDVISKKLIFYYKNLLDCIELLLTKDIIHMDLKNDNVMVANTNNKLGRALLIDYGLSINMKNVNEILKGNDNYNDKLFKLRKFFIAYAPEVNYWPFEIQIITYILYRNHLDVENFINEQNIMIVFDDIMRDNIIYKTFKVDYKNELQIQALEFVKRFIGKTNLDVIKELVSYYKSWDNYALSIMYLRIFDNIMEKFDFGSDNVKKFNSIEKNLVKNISFDPNLRLSISKTRKVIFGEKK